MACPVQRFRGALGRLLKRGLKLAAALRFTATALTGVQREEIERQRSTAAAALTALGRSTVQDHAFVVVLIVAVPLPVL